MGATSLNNEFFTKSCVEWRERLAKGTEEELTVLSLTHLPLVTVVVTSRVSGEFTQENQQRIKHEEEKDQMKIDPWKVGRRK